MRARRPRQVEHGSTDVTPHAALYACGWILIVLVLGGALLAVCFNVAFGN